MTEPSEARLYRERVYAASERTLLAYADTLREGRCTLNEALRAIAAITPMELLPGDHWPTGEVVHDYTTWPPSGL